MTASPGAVASRKFPQQRHLREAHAHLAAYGHALSLPSLQSCASLRECLERVRRAAAEVRGAPRGAPPFLRFMSARPEGWPEARWPARCELDEAAGPDLPVVILSFDYHAAAANSAALAAADLRAGVPVPPNGVVCADADGLPTGLLLEAAARAAWSAAPEPTYDERRGHVRAAAESLAAMGYREVHDLLSPPELGPILAELERSGGLPLRIYLYPPAAQLQQIAAGRAAWESAAVRLAGGKLFADGTLNSRTALVLHDYRDPMPGLPRGKAMLDPEEITAAAVAAGRLGLGLAVHAIGDAAVRMTLDAYERALQSPDARDGAVPSHLRIEHCELIDEADVPRFAALGVVCSVQPCHLLADIEALARYLPHRLGRVLPLRELIDSGCRPGGPAEAGVAGGLWFGSDVPIVRADPADSILAATQRRRAGMPEGGAIAPEQRITEAEAWAAFEAPRP